MGISLAASGINNDIFNLVISQARIKRKIKMNTSELFKNSLSKTFLKLFLKLFYNEEGVDSDTSH